MENTEHLNQEEKSTTEINPFELIVNKIDMLESYIKQMNTYVSELSKVNNNGWESFEDWSKRIATEMKVAIKGNKFDFSVKRKSGIII